MKKLRTDRAHPFALFLIAFIAAPMVAMLPAGALEHAAKSAHAAPATFAIPQEHVDFPPKPKHKAAVKATLHAKPKASRAAARIPGMPTTKKPRSTPALRVGFSWPVTRNVITSSFGWRPFVITPGVADAHPTREFHHGMDIACSLNQEVDAAKGGTIILSGVNPFYGNFVVIQHAGGWSTLYGHLNHRLVNTGWHVASGQRIGLCGATGRADGVHLHWEVRHLGNFYNPIFFLP